MFRFNENFLMKFLQEGDRALMIGTAEEYRDYKRAGSFILSRYFKTLFKDEDSDKVLVELTVKQLKKLMLGASKEAAASYEGEDGVRNFISKVVRPVIRELGKGKAISAKGPDNQITNKKPIEKIIKKADGTEVRRLVYERDDNTILLFTVWRKEENFENDNFAERFGERN